MKKILRKLWFLSLLLLLSVSILACSSNEKVAEKADNEKFPVESTVEDTENSEDIIEAEDTEAVKKVFDYLPTVDKNAELEESEEPGEDNSGMGKEVYTIEDDKAEDVLDEYFDKLEADGWEILEDNRPDLVRATKDEHEAIVVAGQVEEDVKLTIVSK